jgi:hypothetical protein
MGAGDSDSAAGRHWLSVLDGSGQERTITETLALTLWDPNGLRVALDKASELLAEVQPDAVQLHAGPRELLRNGEAVAIAVRALCPEARLWIGVGADGTVDDYAEGRASAAQVIDPLARVAALAQSLGAELLVLDPEGQWKRAKGKNSEGLARDVSLTCAERSPGVVQAVTTYDHPSLHGSFPWRGFLGPGSKASLFLPQVYAGAVAAGQQLVAPHRRSLPRRAETSLASIRAAVRAGMLRSDERDAAGLDTSSRDLDVAPYVQGHSVNEHASSQLLIESPVACVWAAMARMDRSGLAALARAARVRRARFSRPGLVRELQKDLALEADGWLGPLTAAVLDREFCS